MTARATRKLMLGREVDTLPVHRVSGSEPLRLRTHRHCGRSRPLRSAVVEYQLPSVASDFNFTRGLVMQTGTRDTLSCTDCHQPTGSHGHVSGPLVNFDMVHKFRRGYDSQDPIDYLDRELYTVTVTVNCFVRTDDFVDSSFGVHFNLFYFIFIYLFLFPTPPPLPLYLRI